MIFVLVKNIAGGYIAVSFMEDEAVAVFQAFAAAECQTAFEKEVVRREKAVVADMPCRGVALVALAVEDGDAAFMTVEPARIVAPDGGTSPTFALGYGAPAVFKPASAVASERFRHADSQRSGFLRRADLNISVTCLEFDIKVDIAAGSTLIIEGEAAALVEVLNAVLSRPDIISGKRGAGVV